MISSIGSSFTEAQQQATTNLAHWLEEHYKLAANEAAVVLGTSIRYDITEGLDAFVHVVAKVEQSTLARIRP